MSLSATILTGFGTELGKQVAGRVVALSGRATESFRAGLRRWREMSNLDPTAASIADVSGLPAWAQRLQTLHNDPVQENARVNALQVVHWGEDLVREIAALPDHDDAALMYLIIGAAHLRLGELDEAERALHAGFDRARRTGLQADILSNLAGVARQKNNFDLASKLLDQARKFNPRSRVVLANRLAIASLLRDGPAARDAYRELAKHHPDLIQSTSSLRRDPDAEWFWTEAAKPGSTLLPFAVPLALAAGIVGLFVITQIASQPAIILSLIAWTTGGGCV